MTDKFTGWEKHGGGGRYYLISPDKNIMLHYDIAGSAIGIARNWARSSRPWTAQIDRKALKDKRGVVRTFGSKETAFAAAEKEMGK